MQKKGIEFMDMTKNWYDGDWLCVCNLCGSQMRFKNQAMMRAAGWGINGLVCVCSRCMSGLSSKSEGN